MTRAGGSFYTIKLKSACRKPDLSLSGLGPVSLSKIETHLLASLGSKGKIETLLLASEMPVFIPRCSTVLGLTRLAASRGPVQIFPVFLLESQFGNADVLL